MVTELAETIRTKLLGVRQEDQDVVLEDSDWRLILSALDQSWSGPYQVTLCDDGAWMVHTEGDVIAVAGQGNEEIKARIICAALNRAPACTLSEYDRLTPQGD